jgi:hypothetical protein
MKLSGFAGSRFLNPLGFPGNPLDSMHNEHFERRTISKWILRTSEHLSRSTRLVTSLHYAFQEALVDWVSGLGPNVNLNGERRVRCTGSFELSRR